MTEELLERSGDMNAGQTKIQTNPDFTSLRRSLKIGAPSLLRKNVDYTQERSYSNSQLSSNNICKVNRYYNSKITDFNKKILLKLKLMWVNWSVF